MSLTNTFDTTCYPPPLTCISKLENNFTVINHILKYYQGKNRYYLVEPELYDIIVDVLTNVITNLEMITPNCKRTIHCIYWPSDFEVGYPVQGSSGLGTLLSQDYTDKIVSKYKSGFYSHTIDTSKINFDQFHHDIFNLFYHW